MGDRTICPYEFSSTDDEADELDEAVIGGDGAVKIK